MARAFVHQALAERTTADVTTVDGGNWLAVSSASGTAPSILAVTVTPANLPGGGLTPGTFVGELTFTTTGSSVTVPVAVVVADIESRGRNGFDLVEGLQADRRTAELPVIGLASRLHPAALERARALGIFDVVAKFDRNGLIEAIAEATHQSEVEAA